MWFLGILFNNYPEQKNIIYKFLLLWYKITVFV